MFLFDLYVILLGPTFRRLLAYDSPKDGGQGQERGARIARDWNTLRDAWVPAPETKEILQHRTQLVMELANLSKVAVEAGGRLLLRIERLTNKSH
jgi:hypothetical protein